MEERQMEALLFTGVQQNTGKYPVKPVFSS
jgi:hypothetical protein